MFVVELHLRTSYSKRQYFFAPPYWKDEEVVLIPERWMEKDYGPRKLGAQRLAAGGGGLIVQISSQNGLSCT